MGDELLSQIAQDVRDSKHDLHTVNNKVDEMHKMLFVEGPAGKPSLHERVANLESRSKIASWVGSTLAGGVILGAVALVFSFFNPGNNNQ
jgi:hypothetical protein